MNQYIAKEKNRKNSFTRTSGTKLLLYTTAGQDKQKVQSLIKSLAHLNHSKYNNICHGSDFSVCVTRHGTNIPLMQERRIPVRFLL